jgi:hypothetical protein
MTRALTVAAVLIGAPAIAGPRQLIGVIHDRANKPVEGATVIVSGAGGDDSTLSDAHGLYRVVVRDAGRYRVTFVYGNASVERDVVVGDDPFTKLDMTIDLGRGEIVVIHELPAPPVLPHPKRDPRILPRYSESAIMSDVWARAWLLLDIDASGAVTRVKLATRPGHDLELMAIDYALHLRFEPARDAHDRPMETYLLYAIDWPSYWWVQMENGVVTRMPRAAAVLSVPCRGSGPLHLDSRHPVYRDCTPAPSWRSLDAVPWINAPR